MSVEKVQKLIALAGNNPNENEARTAAFLACKAIREAGLVLLEKSDPRLSMRSWAPPPRPEPPPRRPEPPPPPRPQQTYADAKRKAEAAAAEAREIPLRFDSICQGCRAKLGVGEWAWWVKGRGIWCTTCGRPS